MEVKFGNFSGIKKYVVICARYQNEWVFVRHKKRESYEIPGGHIEDDEDFLQAAKRELFEETGAINYSLEYITDYSFNSLGSLFYAEISEFGKLPESEIAEVNLFSALPTNLTYPQIQPALFSFIKNWLSDKGIN